MIINTTNLPSQKFSQANATAGTHSRGLQTRILGNVVTGILSVVAVYVFVALIVYHRKAKSSCSLVVFCHLTSAVAAIFSLASEQIELQFGQYATELCSLYTKLVSSFYFLGILSTFTLIWLRQKFLYSDPLLRSYNGKCWRFFSTFMIIGIYVVLISAGCILVSYLKLTTTNDGCIMSISDHELNILSFTTAALGICGIFFQLSLLFLIVYPLKKTDHVSQPCQSPFKLNKTFLKTKERSCSEHSINETFTPYCKSNVSRPISNYKGRRTEISVSTEKSNNKVEDCMHQTNSVQKGLTVLIRRLVACTAVCIASELVSGVIAVASIVFAPDSYWSLVMHSDLIINTIATTCSFVNWRKRLFPWMIKRSSI